MTSRRGVHVAMVIAVCLGCLAGCGDEKTTTVIERERTVSVERSTQERAAPQPRVTTVVRPAQQPVAASAEWPTSQSGYTVILGSLESRSAAESRAREAGHRGIRAGVLFSGDFASLRPGYWVTFAGVYGSEEQAQAAAGAARTAGFTDAYPRFVGR